MNTGFTKKNFETHVGFPGPISLLLRPASPCIKPSMIYKHIPMDKTQIIVEH